MTKGVQLIKKIFQAIRALHGDEKCLVVLILSNIILPFTPIGGPTAIGYAASWVCVLGFFMSNNKLSSMLRSSWDLHEDQFKILIRLRAAYEQRMAEVESEKQLHKH